MIGKYYLNCIYDHHDSFYRKAYIVTELDRYKLYSYDTLVAEFIHVEEGLDKLIIYNHWYSFPRRMWGMEVMDERQYLDGDTTRRHIREFVIQCTNVSLSANEMREIAEEGGCYL